MSNPVIIKGNKYGFTLVLDKEMPYPKLCDKIRMKFIESAKFFERATQVAICFEGRELSSEEQTHIIDIINDCSELEISYIIDQNSKEELLFQAQIKDQEQSEVLEKDPASVENLTDTKEDAAEDSKQSDSVPNENLPQNESKPEKIDNSSNKEEATIITSEAPKDNHIEPKSDLSQEISEDLGHFYRGTLRSGQSIEFASSIVVIGDVNPGAKVVAKGNIIVIGSLKGAAYAGVGGKQNAFIIALDMDPMQLRIGDLYARSPDSKGFLKKRKQPSKEMQIAFVENNNIYIEPINRAVLNNIIS